MVRLKERWALALARLLAKVGYVKMEMAPPYNRRLQQAKKKMSEKAESFEAFLSHWVNARIQKMGKVDPVDREDIVEKKAAELTALSRDFIGFQEKLREVALSYGGVKEYVRHLYQAADARGDTARPTAHDGADD